jgi:chlorite dismutase
MNATFGGPSTTLSWQGGGARPRRFDASCVDSNHKSAAWWELPQDERRRIFEESSHHIATGLEYLPAVSRRLHHGRDLGEPFDFLTWFEFSPAQASAFEELVDRLRETEEWAYVEREIDIRLSRDAAAASSRVV